jgi:hypothetical protein
MGYRTILSEERQEASLIHDTFSIAVGPLERSFFATPSSKMSEYTSYDGLGLE